MKKLLYILFLLPGMAFAGQPLVAEAPFKSPGTPNCVSISTSAWTAIPDISTTLTGRIGLFVTEVSTNNANMNAMLSVSTAPTDAITIAPIVIKPGVSVYLGLNDKTYLFLCSLHTASETACYESVKQ